MKMKKMRAALAFTALFAIAAPAAAQTIYRGPDGRVIGTESTIGGTRIYRAPDGRGVGSASIIGGTTIYRGANGRTLGAAAPFGGR
jgi:hypothetical protein